MRTSPFADRYIRAKFTQRNFRMIPCPYRFTHSRHALREQPRQQNRRFHLRARHRRRVINRLQLSPANFQRRAVAIAAAYFRAHLP